MHLLPCQEITCWERQGQTGSRTERYSDDASRDSNLVRRQQGQCFYKGAFAVRHQDSDKILGGIKRSQLLIDWWRVSVADLY